MRWVRVVPGGPPGWRTVLVEMCAVLRMRWVRRLLCFTVPIFTVLCFLLWASVVHTIQHFHDCSDHNSRIYLDNLCDNYSNGGVTGSLCEPLCITREIQFEKCLGHGVKLHVLQANWNGNTIILKTPKPLGHRRAMWHVERAGRKLKIRKSKFIEDANRSLADNVVKGSHSAIQVVEDIFSECDLLGDGILYYDEAITCWQLVETDEYVLYSLLQDRSGIPHLYGTCGNMYAVQYAASDPYLGFSTILMDKRTWDFRAQLALALMDMVESIEDTPYGTLYLCDIQEPNFGVVRNNGKLVSKAIDVDISWFEPAMVADVEYERNNTCSSDSDCNFISCLVKCNMTTGKCSGKLASNNLQTICGRIFTQQSRIHPALLRDPPASIRLRLEILLDKCAHPSKITTHIPKDLLNQLRSVLLSSLQNHESES